MSSVSTEAQSEAITPAREPRFASVLYDREHYWPVFAVEDGAWVYSVVGYQQATEAITELKRLILVHSYIVRIKIPDTVLCVAFMEKGNVKRKQKAGR